MSWNYRLIHMDVSHPNEPWYELHEVYYDDNGKPKLWTANAAKVHGSSKAEVIHDLLLMAFDAHRRPVLKESKLPQGSRKP